jgi:hypothetical protein
MIEVRASYLVKMKDVTAVTRLWRQGRDTLWPTIQWSGRIQSMLHGSAQQSLFVYSSVWESMAEWEASMARAEGSPEYRDWCQEINLYRQYGESREVFTILGPAEPADATPDRVEVRSAYLVSLPQTHRAQDHLRRMQEEIWPVLHWGGQNQQMLHGKSAQSIFVWTSVWSNVAAWEQGMANTRGSKEFQSWWSEWKESIDFGASREIFKNL